MGIYRRGSFQSVERQGQRRHGKETGMAGVKGQGHKSQRRLRTLKWPGNKMYLLILLLLLRALLGQLGALSEGRRSDGGNASWSVSGVEACLVL